MHPAPSIILFTTASGAGYGLLFLLGVTGPLGLLPGMRWFGLAALGLALGLVSLGLVASVFHLGRPERAWRAFSQWRSSWLSREGVAALATYGPAGLLALGWVVFEDTSGVYAAAGVLAAVGAVATVACTAMIYASLKPIRHWRNRWVPPVYLAFALMTGALWLNLLLHLFGATAPWSSLLVAAATALAWGIKLGYWREVDTGRGAVTAESATGLGSIGTVRLLEPPHTGENYLLREMAFRVGRKHVRRLRRLALGCGLWAVLALSAVTVLAPGWPAALAAAPATALGSLAAIIERWLFFAEARHTVTLYYGERVA